MKNEKLVLVRNELGLTQPQIAGILGMFQGNYNKIENNVRKLGGKTIELIRDRLKVNPGFLIGNDKEVFTVSTPLISDRIKQSLNNARVRLLDVENILNDTDRELFKDILSNRAYPDKAFLKRAFGSFGLVDIDYIEHGTSTYRIAKSDKPPAVVSEEAGEYESKYKKALEEIDYLRDIITAMKRANEIMDEKIITLEEKLKSKTNEKKLP